MSSLGINININGQQAQQTLDRLGTAFENLEKVLNKTHKGYKKNNDGLNTLSDQGIANIQAGLVQLSTYLLNLSVGIDNTFDKMLTKFKKVENASTQLKIALGLPKDDDLGFKESEKLVKRLAATTQFTAAETYNALRQLTTAGFSSEDARKALAPVLKFVTASGGQIGLAEGIEIARLSVQTMGEDINNLDNSLNILAKGTTKTSIGFEDLQAAMGGVGSAALSFAEEGAGSRMATLFMIAAGQKAIGAEARGSGDMVRQFSNSISGLVSTLLAYEDKVATGKGIRYNKKRNMLFKMLGLENVSKSDVAAHLKKELGDKYPKKGIPITKQQVEFHKINLAKSMLGEMKPDGRFLKKKASELLLTFVEQYEKLKAEKGDLAAEAIFKTGFGVEAGPKVIKGILQELKKQGLKSARNLTKEIENHQNITTRAQKESLKTIGARIDLAESAEDAFSNTIFAEDAMYKGTLDTYTAVITALNEIVGSNKGLATGISATGRAFQAFTKIGTNVGFMLTAAATFSIALNHASKASGMAITTLGGTLRAFYAQFLAPTLRVVFLFSGGIGVLTIAFLGLIRYLSDAETLGGGLLSVFQKLKNNAQTLSGVFRLAFSDVGGDKEIVPALTDYLAKMKAIRDANSKNSKMADYGGKPVKVSALELQVADFRDILGPAADDALQLLSVDTVKTLGGFVSQIKTTFNTISQVITAAMYPVSLVMGEIFNVLGFGFYALTFPINMLIQFLNLFGSEINEVSDGLELIGTVLGVVLAGFLAYKAVTMVASLISTFYTGVFNAATTMGTSYERLNSVNSGLIGAEIKHISVLDQVRLKMQLLTATEERQDVITQRLIEKYNNLSFAQQQVHNKTGALNNRFGKFYDKVETKLNNGLHKARDKMGGFASTMNKAAGVSGILSMVLMHTGNEGLQTVGSGLLLVSGILPLITGGFLSMAVAVLAAIWPILALVAAIGAAVFIYKKFFATKEDAEQTQAQKYGGSPKNRVSSTQSISPANSPSMPALSPTTSSASPAYASAAPASGGVVNNNSKTSINRVEVKYVAKGHPLDKKEFDRFGAKLVDTLQNPRPNNNMGAVGT